LIRMEMERYKNQEFGINRTWSSISCFDFCQPINQQDVSTVARVISDNDNDNSSSWEYLSGSEYLIDQWSHTLRHDVCNNTSVPVAPANFDKTQTFIYMGPNSWQPQEWNQMVDLMQDAIQKHPLVGTWNELVLQIPPSPSPPSPQSSNTTPLPVLSKTTMGSEMVQAVFYIQTGNTHQDEAARHIAQKQAKAYQKPLLYVQLDPLNNTQSHHIESHNDKTTEGDIFHCVEPTVADSLRRSNNIRHHGVKDDWVSTVT
jgi:hypothetical protein